MSNDEGAGLFHRVFQGRRQDARRNPRSLERRQRPPRFRRATLMDDAFDVGKQRGKTFERRLKLVGLHYRFAQRYLPVTAQRDAPTVAHAKDCGRTDFHAASPFLKTGKK